MSRFRRTTAVVARAVLVVLLVSMLAGAAAVRTTNTLAVVVVADVSGSARRFAATGLTDEDGRPVGLIDALDALTARLAAARGPDDLLGLVAFDGQAIAVATPTRGDVADRSMDVKREEGTDIGAALRRAASLLPPDAAGRIVLISDGNETSGNAREAAAELAGATGARTTIDVVPLAYSVGDEVVVESVDAPPRAPTGSTINVRVVLRATAASTGTLRLLREGQEVDLNGDAPGTGRRVSLEPGRNVERVEVKLDGSRVHRFEAVYEPDSNDGALVGDTYVENNRGSAFTVTPGSGAILVVDGVGNGDPNGAGATLAGALGSEGATVELVAPAAVPTDLLALQKYDLVVLENVPAEALTERQQRILVDHVHDLGGGLVMVGGPDSFGAGGWKGTPVADILPVKLDLPEQLIVPEAAVIFVLDRSGSMAMRVGGSSRRQQEIANEAAAAAVRSLDKQDLVGVVAFHRAAVPVQPLGPNDDPDKTCERILSIPSGGGTDILPALEWARAQMKGVDAKLKHVIVLTDGASMNAGLLPQYAAEMREEGVRISTIGVGDQADYQLLQAVAGAGGGKYYRVTNPQLLPRIFLRAVRIVRQPLIREGLFTPVLLPTASPLTAGLGTPPKLDGLVLTQAREDPTVTYAMAAPSGEPLLAHWNVGLGKVAVWTSDAHEWASRWLDWPGYKRMWGNIARQISRASTSSDGELTVALDADRMHLRFEAYNDDGTPRDLLSVEATVYPPTGEPREVTLTQTGPGVYEGEARADETGSHIVVVRPRAGTRALVPVVGGVSVASGAEYRSLTSNVELLREVADETGGRLLTLDVDPGEVFDRAGVPQRRVSVPIWRLLLVWTLGVMLFDVGTRRVAWDRLLSREKRGREAVQREVAGALEGLRARAKKGKGEESRALGADDAAAVARAERKRRQEARRARLEAMRTGTGGQGEDAPRAEKSETKDEAGEDGGLLAAKRRARKRYEGEEIE